MRVLKVHLTRTGGLAGATLEASLDSAQLVPPLAQELEGLASRASLPVASTSTTRANTAPTGFRYALTLEQDGVSRHLEVDGDGLAAPMADLIEFVLKVARGKGMLRTKR